MLKAKKLRHHKKNQRGMAVIESIPVLFVMVLVFNFSLGFFGGIHSGILNSIGAYNYSYETFRYRSNLMYFRPGNSTVHYKSSLNRVHGIIQDGSALDPNQDQSAWPVTVRDITFSSVAENSRLMNLDPSDRDYAGRRSSNNIWFAGSEYTPDRQSSIQTPRIWVKTLYGICIHAECTTDNQPERSTGD